MSHCQGFLPLWTHGYTNPHFLNWPFLVFVVDQIIIFVQMPGSLSVLSVGVNKTNQRGGVVYSEHIAALWKMPPRPLTSFEIYTKAATLKNT